MNYSIVAHSIVKKGITVLHIIANIFLFFFVIPKDCDNMHHMINVNCLFQYTIGNRQSYPIANIDEKFMQTRYKMYSILVKEIKVTFYTTESL